MASIDTREKILSAAGPIFADRGYKDGTVRDICEAAGVNVAAVNYYFGDKHRLYVEAVRHAHELRAQISPPPDIDFDEPAEENLRKFVSSMIARMLGDEQPWQYRLTMRELIEPSGACAELVESRFRPQFETLMRIVSGLFDEPIPVWRIRHLAFSVIGQIMHYRVAGEVVRLITPAEEFDVYYTPEHLTDHICLATIATAKAIGASESKPSNTVEK